MKRLRLLDAFANMVRAERKRLRRKYLIKARERSHNTMDRWLDFEYFRAGIFTWVAVLVTAFNETEHLRWIILPTLVISIPWWIYITVVWMTIFARFNDKRYMMITRHHLSSEYRR